MRIGQVVVSRGLAAAVAAVVVALVAVGVGTERGTGQHSADTLSAENKLGPDNIVKKH